MTPPRFDIDALMARLGEKRARRAETYFGNGWVRLIAVEDRRVLALVTGETGALYPVEAQADGEGECACPDFPIERICKHVGAVALAADALGPRQMRTLDGRLSALRDTLAGESREALVGRLMDLARGAPGVIELLEPSEE